MNIHDDVFGPAGQAKVINRQEKEIEQLRAEVKRKTFMINKLMSERMNLKAEAVLLREALQGLCDAYLVYGDDGAPLRIRVIKIGHSDFNKAFDAFETALKALEATPQTQKVAAVLEAAEQAYKSHNSGRNHVVTCYPDNIDVCVCDVCEAVR